MEATLYFGGFSHYGHAYSWVVSNGSVVYLEKETTSIPFI